MTPDLGSTRSVESTDERGRDHDRGPGCRPARLAEAHKQLAIVLEGVDLDAEAELGEALTEAVAALHRASTSAWSRTEDGPSSPAPGEAADARGDVGAEPSARPERADADPARSGPAWEAMVD